MSFLLGGDYCSYLDQVMDRVRRRGGRLSHLDHFHVVSCYQAGTSPVACAQTMTLLASPVMGFLCPLCQTQEIEEIQDRGFVWHRRRMIAADGAWETAGCLFSAHWLLLLIWVGLTFPYLAWQHRRRKGALCHCNDCGYRWRLT